MTFILIIYFIISGIEMYEYLSTISNWQLYILIERGNLFYEMMSDNIIEILFAWCKEIRSYATPYYFLKLLIYENHLRNLKLQISANTEKNRLTRKGHQSLRWSQLKCLRSRDYLFFAGLLLFT